VGIVYANSLTAVFICNKKLLQNFLLHINYSTRDVHSRERKIVWKQNVLVAWNVAGHIRGSLLIKKLKYSPKTSNIKYIKDKRV